MIAKDKRNALPQMTQGELLEQGKLWHRERVTLCLFQGLEYILEG